MAGNIQNVILTQLKIEIDKYIVLTGDKGLYGFVNQINKEL